jgi:hypothetical protein
MATREIAEAIYIQAFEDREHLFPTAPRAVSVVQLCDGGYGLKVTLRGRGDRSRLPGEYHGIPVVYDFLQSEIELTGRKQPAWRARVLGEK